MMAGIVAGQMRPAPAPASGIEWLGAVATTHSSDGTTMAVNLPPVSAGDLLVMHVAWLMNSSLSVPAGWVGVGAGGENSRRSYVMYRIAESASEASTVTITNSVYGRMAAAVHRIKAGTFYSPVAIEKATATASGSEPNPPSLSPSWGAKQALWIAASGSGSGYGPYTVKGYPYPDGQVTATSGASGGYIPVLGSCYTIATAAMLDPPAFSLSGGHDASVTDTIAIRAAE